MRALIVFLLIPSLCATQMLAAGMTQTTSPTQVSGQTQTTPQSRMEYTSPQTPTGTIVVPPGTQIPLTLVSPVRSKSTKVGATVRAQVAFPVTVGAQLAIPAGTYAEGIVNVVTMRDKQTHAPNLQIHFTRLLFANGYSVPLNAANTMAFMILPEESNQTIEIVYAGDGAPYLGEGFAGAPQQTLPPLPHVGPNPAVIGGIAAGASVGLFTLVFFMARHSQSTTDFLLFDNGWQFQMVLTTALTLDASKVAAAASTPTAQ